MFKFSFYYHEHMTKIRLNCCQLEEQDTLFTVVTDGSL